MCTFLLRNGVLFGICLVHCGICWICERGLFRQEHNNDILLWLIVLFLQHATRINQYIIPRLLIVCYTCLALITVDVGILIKAVNRCHYDHPKETKNHQAWVQCQYIPTIFNMHDAIFWYEFVISSTYHRNLFPIIGKSVLVNWMGCRRAYDKPVVWINGGLDDIT